MIWDIITNILIFIFGLLLCVFMHEKGHIMMLKKFGYKYSHKFVKGLKFEITCEDERITRDQDKRVLGFGITCGIMPIPILGFLGYNPISVLCLFIIYVLFCLDDIKRLIKQ